MALEFCRSQTGHKRSAINRRQKQHVWKGTPRFPFPVGSRTLATSRRTCTAVVRLSTSAGRNWDLDTQDESSWCAHLLEAHRIATAAIVMPCNRTAYRRGLLHGDTSPIRRWFVGEEALVSSTPKHRMRVPGADPATFQPDWVIASSTCMLLQRTTWRGVGWGGAAWRGATKDCGGILWTAQSTTIVVTLLLSTRTM